MPPMKFAQAERTPFQQFGYSSGQKVSKQESSASDILAKKKITLDSKNLNMTFIWVAVIHVKVTMNSILWTYPKFSNE